MVSLLSAANYQGRVVDIRGAGISYATVYPLSDPVSGTATNEQGYFHFASQAPANDQLVISFIGYEKQVLPLSSFLVNDTLTVVLQEQPIALEETVVAAKASKQRNKRKQMSYLLHLVYEQMAKDFPKENACYEIVSDARMDSEGKAWGMEQMLSTIVVLPERKKDGGDSVQFHGNYCKRFMQPAKRAIADTIMAGQSLERMHKDMHRMANAIDSGVVVHRMLFESGNARVDFERHVNDVRHWTVSNESEGETVLTHTEKHNYLGIFKYEILRHFIIDSHTYSIRRLSEYCEMAVHIPFGYKLDADQLQLLNMVVLSDDPIDKFRLRKAEGTIRYNTIYQSQAGHLYIGEKNLHANMHIQGTKQMEVPMVFSASLRTKSVQTENVQPRPRNWITNRVKRQIVEIY